MRKGSLVTIILLFYYEIGLCQDGPCPSLIQYSSNPTLNYGLFSLHGVQVNRTYDIVVTMTFRGTLPSTFNAQLFPLNEQNVTENKLLDNEPVIYRINFPGQKHFPTVTRIKVNKRVLCRGQGLIGKVTKLNFQHTLDTSKFSVDWNRWNMSIVNQENDNNLAIGCGPEQFTCGSGECIHLRWICDGRNDCSDESDEDLQECETICPPSDFRCKVSKQCIPSNWVCDTDNDCSDGLDESNCGQESSPQTTFLKPDNITAEVLRICGTIQANNTIQGLEELSSDDESWPWLVAIFINDPSPSSFQCAGTLISSKTVLTAAHCVEFRGFKFKAEQWLVVVGRHNFLNRTVYMVKARTVEKIIIHPEFDQRLIANDADIGIIIIKEAIIFSDYIRPVCLWTEEDDLDKIIGENAKVFGFGRGVDGDENTFSPELLTSKIVSNEDCLSLNHEYSKFITNTTICAGDRDGYGKCRSSGGSGLILKRDDRWVIRGLVSVGLSSGNESCDLEDYFIYTDIAKFAEWVLSEIVY